MNEQLIADLAKPIVLLAREAGKDRFTVNDVERYLNEQVFGRGIVKAYLKGLLSASETANGIADRLHMWVRREFKIQYICATNSKTFSAIQQIEEALISHKSRLNILGFDSN